jgi:hypothetical protein
MGLVVDRLREALGVELETVSLFEFPTVGALAEHLQARTGGDRTMRTEVEDRARKGQAARARRRPVRGTTS